MIRVFITAPNQMMRAGLRVMLSSSEFEITGEASTPFAFAAEGGEADVVIMAGDESLEEVARIARGEQSPALVILTNDNRAIGRLRNLPLRGWGVLSLDAPGAELQAAVTAVAQGLIVLPRLLAERLLSQSPQVEPLEPGNSEEALTGREREVLELLSQGLSNKLIARRLQISEHTVKFHISSLYTKLGAASRTDAVSRGARRGLITL